jgi:hypothetical protein
MTQRSSIGDDPRIHSPPCRASDVVEFVCATHWISPLTASALEYLPATTIMPLLGRSRCNMLQPLLLVAALGLSQVVAAADASSGQLASYDYPRSATEAVRSEARAVNHWLPPSTGAATVGGGPRQVRWWMNSGGTVNNLKLIDAHPKAITGLYTYLGLGVGDSGHFEHGSRNATNLRELFAPYYARGLDVTPALSLTNKSIISGNAAKYVAEVAAFAKSVNISGLMLDFEPDTSETVWVHAYADYVTAFSQAMHEHGLRAEMCVSAWGILDGHALPNGEGYGIYAKTGVDKMMSMSGTYFGTNVTNNLVNVDNELHDGVSLHQLAVGIGTQIDPTISGGCPPVGPMGCKVAGGQCYNWTEQKLTSFVAALVERGVTTIDMWRADIDAEGDCTAPYYFEVAENFLAGVQEQ